MPPTRPSLVPSLASSRESLDSLSGLLFVLRLQSDSEMEDTTDVLVSASEFIKGEQGLNSTIIGHFLLLIDDLTKTKKEQFEFCSFNTYVALFAL